MRGLIEDLRCLLKLSEDDDQTALRRQMDRARGLMVKAQARGDGTDALYWRDMAMKAMTKLQALRQGQKQVA
jgi:hypothetical protein